ncbi:RNase H family protein [Thiosulfativibrio zosterae]|uniref:RNase H type-1 domain-containing protein n=1 Tax=Thiosulfativibrio zosterae TaxID=2675053 RepID=A0A6F8PQW4_9GAMM|nr:RNase H family protein [Thiosulfativibrio zosterae]BBP44476.1 hypothetical protein THMIRHAT_22220 [Thiosulfativibrio zosterae]
MRLITIYTDGGYDPKTHIGSWAFVAEADESLLSNRSAQQQESFSLSGSVLQTQQLEAPSLQMEVRAVVEALTWLDCENRHQTILIVSDSKIVVDAINHDLQFWSENDWQKKKNRTLKCVAMWQALWQLLGQIPNPVKAKWVKGHANHPMNERVDSLATQARQAVCSPGLSSYE